ncbi:MAG: xanthine dehydrogenase family protein molybdopterin-binding subunit, partial [Chloroflexota bacterium]
MLVGRSPVGASVPRLDGREKVNGSAVYAGDIALPGMLWLKVLRSPYRHARIISVDTARAKAAPGVRGVISGKDHPGLLTGRAMRDMPVLCWDKVRYIGDRVAAVAADTREQADAALELISVVYEELPPVVDALQAMEPGAPLLHDDVTQYKGGDAKALIPEVHNGLSRVSFGKGDLDAGFREADLTVEHTFRVPSRHTGYIEPHAGVLAIDPDGRVQVWMSSKSPFRARNELAFAVNIPPETVRFNPVLVGGDFGGKGDTSDLPIAYLLARETGRPVKFIKTYTEELSAGNPSHQSVITIRTGLKRDGRMVARYVRAIHDSGAYGAYKPVAQVAITGVSHGGGSYRIDHTLFEAIHVYTNQVPAGFFRAPGAPQVLFGVESHTDLLAQELGMDPAEFRRRNLVLEGQENAVGHKLTGVRSIEVLEGALAAAGWGTPKPGKYYGRGIAMYDRHIPGGVSGTVLEAHEDGAVTILSPVFDQGVGAHTVLRQMVAQELQLPMSSVRVVTGHTDNTPFDPGTGGSRGTNLAGHAVMEAVRLLREDLAKRAAALLECPEEVVGYSSGQFWIREDPRQSVGIGAIVRRSNGAQPIAVTSNVDVKLKNNITCFAAQVAEVEVDPETGKVQLHRFVTAHDVGTIINPVTHQGQIDGGAIQGIGMALMEELLIEDGQVVTNHLGDYKLPTIADIPELSKRIIAFFSGK